MIFVLVSATAMHLSGDIGWCDQGMYPGNVTSSLDTPNRPGMVAQGRMAEAGSLHRAPQQKSPKIDDYNQMTNESKPVLHPVPACS